MESAAAVLKELLSSEEPKKRTRRKGLPHARSEFTSLAQNVRISTGVRRLDDLLGGGLPQGSATLVHGPPFSGKGILQRLFYLDGLRKEQPCTYLLTDQSASEMSRVLSTYDARTPEYEESGRVSYVDLYTKLIGEHETHPNAHYLESPQSWEEVLTALERVERDQQRRRNPAPSRLIIQSISSLMVEIGPQPTFRFLRTLLGRFCRRGGTAMLAIESGMHEPHEVQTIKHLCSGMISTRESDESYFLRVEGLPSAFQPGWVEYDFDHTKFELVGSFASGRIRHAGPMIVSAP